MLVNFTTLQCCFMSLYVHDFCLNESLGNGLLEILHTGPVKILCDPGGF